MKPHRFEELKREFAIAGRKLRAAKSLEERLSLVIAIRELTAEMGFLIQAFQQDWLDKQVHVENCQRRVERRQ